MNHEVNDHRGRSGGDRHCLFGRARATDAPTIDSGVSLTVDTDSLFVDGTNHVVGIGTASPGGGSKLEVHTGSDSLIGTVIKANSGSQSANLFELLGQRPQLGRDFTTAATRTASHAPQT